MRFQRLVLHSMAGALVVLATACAAPGQNGKKVLATDKAPPAIGPYSQMVSHGSVIYLSGVIPIDMAGKAVVGTTIEEQTRVVLNYIGENLRSQGLSYEDVLMSTVYMKDLNDFGTMNKIYAEYFKSNPPARGTVQVARLPRDVLVEIAVIAGRR